MEEKQMQDHPQDRLQDDHGPDQPATPKQ